MRNADCHLIYFCTALIACNSSNVSNHFITNVLTVLWKSIYYWPRKFSIHALWLIVWHY